MAHNGQQLNYLRLVEDDWALQILSSVPGLEQLRGQTAQTVDSAPHAAFAVSTFSHSEPWGLSPVLHIETVNWPPLLLVCRHSPTETEQEKLRRRGVSAVLTSTDDPFRSEQLIQALTESNEWFDARLNRVPLSDLLQMLASDGRSGLIWIGCPHSERLSSKRWESAGSACTGDTETCTGWVARLHMHHGQLTYAETPAARGLEALAQCLALAEGYVRVHEVYMTPRETNLSGSIQQLLLRSATFVDEYRRDDSHVDNNYVEILSSPPISPKARRPRTTPPRRRTPSQSEVYPSPPPFRSRSRGPSPSVGERHENKERVIVNDESGQGDSENVAAVGTMCCSAFSTAGEHLQLGEVKSWVLLGPQKALYARCSDSEPQLVLDTATDNAFYNLRLIFEEEGL